MSKKTGDTFGDRDAKQVSGDDPNYDVVHLIGHSNVLETTGQRRHTTFRRNSLPPGPTNVYESG